MDEEKGLAITEFSWAEFHRLIGKIPETDPTTSAYGTLLESIERYGAIYKFVDWALNVPVQNPVVVEEETPDNIIQFTPPVVQEAEQTEEVPDEPTEELDPATVKSLVAKARSEKKIASVKSWIQENFGVDGFTAIPAARYPEVMAKLKELGVI